MLESITHISVLEWCLLAALGALFTYQLYYYIRYMAGVQRRVRHQEKKRFRWKEVQPTSAEGEESKKENVQPGVSVVICARNEGYNLQAYLQALCSQKYPEFEVIVVNDASEDDTQLVLEHYSKLFRNLRLSFVPNDAWVRSSKKLALTLAAKAAKYDYLLLTDADCRPESPYWIAEMMKGFCSDATEVVLGYGAYFEEDTKVNSLIQYDTIFSSMQWLGMAMSRHPYMGVGRNLAYRKSTFFGNKGFSGILGQRAGDDDLFVNKVATRHNTEVVLTPDSYTWAVPKPTHREWKVQKYRQLSVVPAFHTGAKLRMGFEPTTRIIWYLLLLAIAVLAAIGLIANPIVWMLAIVLFLSRLTWQIVMINRAAHIFGAHGFGLNILFFDIFLPLCNMSMHIKHIVRRKREMQW